VSILQRLNGYKPFLYNVTVDACKFYKNQKSNPVAGYIYSLFRSFSNMNHSCPYDVSLFTTPINKFLYEYPVCLQHDVILDKLNTNFLHTKLTEVLPFPHGGYLFHSNWYAYDINRASVNIYITIS